MARKEINIFGTSFLDLLSGALAAVIILFIIVPKMTSEQQNALEELEQLNNQVEELNNLMEQLQNSVPQDIYDQIQRQLEELQETVGQLTEEIRDLQGQLSESQQRVSQLEEENEQLRQRIAQLENESRQSGQEGQGISDGKVFGMDAELGIVCLWTENVDVDLFVKNLADGSLCYYGNKDTAFGNLNQDITSRSTPDDDRYELFYQSEVVPGRYLIYVNIFERSAGWRGQRVPVEGYVVLFPGKPNQIRIPFPQITLTQRGQNVPVGTLTVTPNNITLQ